MAEYIEREALAEKLRIDYCGNCTARGNDIKCRCCEVDDVLGEIEDATAADVVEVRHGEWRKRKNWRLYVCSECSHENDNPYRYCPNCGAKMDGKG